MRKGHIISQEFNKRAALYEEAKWVRDEAFLDTLVSFSELRGDECALEIGVGSGTVAARMKEHTGVLIGVDASKDMLEQAHRYLPRHHLLCCQIEDLTALFLDETFDLVYCRAVLHHLNIPRTLREMHRLIKVNGKLLVAETVAFDEEDEAFQLRFLESLHTGHTQVPTAERLSETVGQAGFAIQKSRLWLEEGVSLQNMLASTARSDREKAGIFTLFRESSEQTRSGWNVRFVDHDVLFDRRWAIILATRY